MSRTIQGARHLALSAALCCAPPSVSRVAPASVLRAPERPSAVCWWPDGVGVALYYRQRHDAPQPAGVWAVTLREALAALPPKQPERGAESVPRCEAQP